VFLPYGCTVARCCASYLVASPDMAKLLTGMQEPIISCVNTPAHLLASAGATILMLKWAFAHPSTPTNTRELPILARAVRRAVRINLALARTSC
jgi:hypothetical protein